MYVHPPSTSPDKTVIPQNEPPSIKLEGERTQFLSCDNGLTRNDMDAMGVSSHVLVHDDKKWPKNLENVSECVDKPLEQKDQDDLPEGAQVDPDNLGDKVDTSTASWTIKDVRKKLKKLCRASEHIRKWSEQRSQADSPRRA